MRNEIAQPFIRSRIRRAAGRKAYIVLRRANWLSRKTSWASQKHGERLEHQIAEHKSIILRPLKDVDMYLQENKRTNLRIASGHLDDVIIEPGETLSFWKLVGAPSARKGYLEGLILNQGRIETEVGGGLCQLGNLLFWLFAHTPLDIVERHRHGFDVFPDQNRTIPFGAGATLAFNYIDLQVRNNTESRFQLQLWQDDVHLRARVLADRIQPGCYSVEERNHLMKQQPWGGYSRHNQIFRIITHDHGVQREQLLVENHALMMYNPMLTPTATTE